MWSVSSSIFHRRQRKSGGEPCMEKWVMMSFSLAMDFHFLYSSSTFFFRLKRDSWGTLFCLKKAWGKRPRQKQWSLKNEWMEGSDLTRVLVSKCTWSGAGKHDSVWEAQLWGVKFIMVWRMSLHHVPWMESEPVKKSTHTDAKLEDVESTVSKDEWIQRAIPVTCVARARVRIKARFSSSDSADRTVFGSLRKRVNCGCTSELPNAVIKRRAVLSTLERRATRWKHMLKMESDMRVRVHITTDAAGSGWSGVQQPDCAGDWAAGLCNAAGCGASCS